MDKFELVRFTDDGFELDVRTDYENDTVWLTQREMAALFDVDIGRVSRHISNIFKEKELPKKSNLRKTQFTGIDKPIGLSGEVIKPEGTNKLLMLPFSSAYIS